ncbi:hypothetical protein EON65_11935 [archaeon]|nr:MAG: hypothetical protein EON65_11935 [archaeon]
MISDAAIEKMSAIQIRDVITELNHQVFHLERSQKELEEALEEDPEDRDFKFAFFENIETIGLKKESLVKLENRLKDIDVARCMEELAFERQLIRDSAITQAVDAANAVLVERETQEAASRVDRSAGPQWAEEDEELEIPPESSAVVAEEVSEASEDAHDNPDSGLYL